MTLQQQLGPITLAVGSATDVGLKRKLNEDSLHVQLPVLVVADGMGGYEAGDRASAAVVEAFQRTFTDTGRFATIDQIGTALALADDLVADVADATTRGAGSTVAGAGIVDVDGVAHWLVFNVGDSRVYRNQLGALQQITVDHSLGQELYQSGQISAAELAVFPDRNIITRAVGAPNSQADSWITPVVTGERLMLCSDGLTTEVSDEAIRASLTLGGRPDSVAASLVDQAKAAGGRDNITVVVIDVVAGGQHLSADDTTGVSSVAFVDAEDETTIPVGR